MADEIQNLIINVQGREQVDLLKTAVQQEEQALRDAIAANGAQDEAAIASAQTLKHLQEQLQQTQNTVRSTTAGTQNYQQVAMAASFALQDFTSANGGLAQQLMSVNNNIPTILMGLGGSAGMVALVGALGTVVTLAAPGVIKLVDSLDLFGMKTNEVKGYVEKLQARIKELESMKIRPTVDATELDNLKRKLKELQTAEQAFNEFRNTKGEHERRAGEETGQLLAMAPGGARALADRLAVEVGKELQATDGPLGDLRKQRAKALSDAEKGNRGELAPASLRENTTRTIKAEKLAGELKEKIDARVRELIGDAVTGDTGQAHQQVGAMFRGATAGNDPGARKTLADRLRAIGQYATADAIEATTPQTAEVARKEEIQDQHDADRLGVNRDIRGIRNLRNQREARPVLDDFAKGMDLPTEAARLMKIIRDRGGVDGKKMTAQEQVDELRKRIQEILEDELKSKGLLNAGSSRMAEQMARQFGGAARDQVDAAHRKAVEQGKEDANAPVKDPGKDARERDQALAKGLGDPFIAAAQREMLAINMLRGKNREAAQRRFQSNFTRQAGRRLMAGGMDGGKAAELAQRSVEFLNQDIGRQVNQMRAMAGGTMTDAQVRMALIQILGRGAQQGQAPPAGGAGFRSVAPTAPQPAGLATGIAAGANRGLTSQLAGMSGQQLANQQKLISSVGELGMSIAAQRQKLEAQTRTIGFLEQSARAERRRNNPPGPTNLGTGDPR